MPSYTVGKDILNLDNNKYCAKLKAYETIQNQTKKDWEQSRNYYS